ncbi:MAG: hypothetical protein J1E40_08150 [Oscillospiraceae bacterium]|nr:hypothetical protein [Oscillospiraceae bacterium]
MNDILLDAAQSFNRISHTNYEFTISKPRKIIITSISADKGDFTHIIGLDHLKDVWQFISHNTKIKGKMFRDILNGKYTCQKLLNETSYLNKCIPKTFNSVTNKEYTISERISKVCQIDKLLDVAYTGAIYKWDLHRCNIMTSDGRNRKITINADYLFMCSITTKSK